MKHTVSIEILDTMNDCILPIMDTSIYSDKIPVDCSYIDVLVPGFTCAVRLDVAPGFCLKNITACDLELQANNCGDVFNALPDGIYSIKYSVAPNEYVYAEYNHLRITSALKKVNSVYCNMKSSCSPDVIAKKKYADISLVESMLKGAKAKVEFCHTPEEGMELYNYALKLLAKLVCFGGNC